MTKKGKLETNCEEGLDIDYLIQLTEQEERERLEKERAKSSLIEQIEIRHLRASDKNNVQAFYRDWFDSGMDDKFECCLEYYFNIKAYYNTIGLFVHGELYSVAVVVEPGKSNLSKYKEEFATIYFIGTISTKQSKGYGGQLLDYIIESLERNDIGKGIVLNAANDDLIPFYRDFGFELYDVEDDEHLNIMILEY